MTESRVTWFVVTTHAPSDGNGNLPYRRTVRVFLRYRLTTQVALPCPTNSIMIGEKFVYIFYNQKAMSVFSGRRILNPINEEKEVE